MNTFITLCLGAIMFMTVKMTIQTLESVTPKKIEVAMKWNVSEPVDINGSH